MPGFHLPPAYGRCQKQPFLGLLALGLTSCILSTWDWQCCIQIKGAISSTDRRPITSLASSSRAMKENRRNCIGLYCIFFLLPQKVFSWVQNCQNDYCRNVPYGFMIYFSASRNIISTVPKIIGRWYLKKQTNKPQNKPQKTHPQKTLHNRTQQTIKKKNIKLNLQMIYQLILLSFYIYSLSRRNVLSNYLISLSLKKYPFKFLFDVMPFSFILFFLCSFMGFSWQDATSNDRTNMINFCCPMKSVQRSFFAAQNPNATARQHFQSIGYHTAACGHCSRKIYELPFLVFQVLASPCCSFGQTVKC